MPALTSPRAYPYPLDGDPINVAGDIQKLAVKIDDDITAYIASTASSSATALSKKYDKVGGTISGNAYVTGTFRADGATSINDRLDVTGNIYMSHWNGTPGISFVDQQNGEGWGDIRCANGDLYVDGDNDLFFRSNNVTVGGVVGASSPIWVFGKTGPNTPTSISDGVEIPCVGGLVGRVVSTANLDSSYSNFIGQHIGAMNVAGQLFAVFQNGTSAKVVAIGSISQVGTSGVKFNTTSDYRMKDDLGPIVGATGKVLQLQPKHLRAKTDLIEYDGFIAHEVDAVVDIAVTGAKDALLPPDDEFDPGGISPQQLDMTRLIPIMVGALQDALNRIAVLEAAV
ncbi:MAG TPA: tail fiber domain-containing protein [Desertimonas sp.]|nr:tail fiber domain-containing protein [Desertimonas sp.]